MSATQWWVSTDMIGKPGSPTVAGPFSSMPDAIRARTAMERYTSQTFSIFEQPTPPPSISWSMVDDLRGSLKISKDQGDDCTSSRALETFLAAIEVTS